MKRIKQFSIWMIALFAITVTNPAWAAVDTQNPKPGGYEEGYPKAVGPTSIELRWKRATDNKTAPARLRYRVSWKRLSGGNWRETGFMYFDLYQSYMTYIITDLDPNTEYVMKVQVVDEANNWEYYGDKIVKTLSGDKTRPTPGGYLSGYPKALGTTSIEVKWKRASDNETGQANLRYLVEWKKKSGGSWQDSHPWPFTNWPKDMTSYTITGLEPNTEYQVNVLVYDEAKNGMSYGEKTVTTGAAPDTQAPTAPVITSLTSTQTTITATWAPSTDNVTPQNEIEYVVWYGISGYVPKYPPKGATSYTLSGLEPGKEYTILIRAKDAAGNYTDGPEKKIKTKAPADTQAPTPGGYQSGYPKATGPTTIEVKWKRATDNVTTQANLRYLVGWKKKSGGSWQYSHSGVVTDLPKDMTTYTIENLEPNTEYVVKVRVVDEAGKGTWYGEKTVKTQADTQAPTPGGYEAGYPKAVGTTIEVKWKRATDNVTAPANLRYVVAWEKKSGGSWHYSHPEPFTNFPKDWTSYTITGLDPNTEYYVEVGVFDEAGYWKWYGEKTVTTGAGAADTEDPTPGGYEAGYPKATGPTTIEVKWKRATDNVTAPANLRYKVSWKKKSGGSWRNSHFEPFTNFPKDWTSYIITGLEPNTEYYVDVMVVDEARNYQYYDQKTVTTGAGAADTQKPTPGGYEAGYPKATGPTTIEVKWKRATDNVTAPANLRYMVSWKKKSGGSWQNSHPEPFTNFPKDMTSYTITGLEPNTEYYVAVLVFDEAGNWKWYGEKTVTTGAGAVDIQDPTPGGYEAGYPKAVGTTIEVKWKRATDNVTAPANLRYRVSWIKKSGVSQQDSHPEPFTNFPKDWTSYTITGLEPNTEYLVDVLVVDEAGNWKFCGPKTVTTGAASVTIPVTGVTLSPASLNLEVGATKSLTHTVLPATATNKAVTWSSSNTAIATVDGSGTVKGIAPGTATITVTTADGGKTATAAVTVKEATAPAVKVTSVTLNRNSVTINGDYEEIKLTATVAPATATDQSLTWTSDNPSVASVDATGLVTIHKKGKARITVTANDGSGRSDACDFNVIMTVANETIDGLRMWAHGGALHLTLPNAATVHIYNVNGAIVKTLFLPSGDHVEPLADGMYLVRVGERVRKILVK